MPYTNCPKCGATVCHPVGQFFCLCGQNVGIRTCKQTQGTQFAEWSESGPDSRERAIIRRVLNKVETLQTPDELEWLYNQIKPETVLEIGGWSGGTSLLFTDLWEAEVWTIDQRPKHDYAGRRDRLLVANSQESSTVERLKQMTRGMLTGGMFDLVFIDADHSAAGVARDYELYAPLARVAVGFHDILWERASVGAFFDSLPGRKTRIDIYQGIGLLWH